MRLKKWVKITLTVTLLIFTIMIYLQLGKWGNLAQNNGLYGSFIFLGWCWIVVQPLMINSIWEN